MAEPFLGQITLYGCNFPPRNWALCQGQLLSIAQNTALFSLLGTMYGGNGQTTFALPDLRGRTPLSFGQGPGLSNYTQGDSAGVTNVTLSTGEMAAHGHTFNCTSAAGTTATSANNQLGVSQKGNPVTGLTKAAIYSPNSANLIPLAPNSLGLAGSNQPHNNIQPYLGLNYSIAINGIFPARN